MQFKQLFIALCALTLIFSACKKDDEVITMPPVEDTPSPIKVTLGSGDVLEYNFDECAFDNMLQRSRESQGISGLEDNLMNYRTLSTAMYNDGEDTADYLQVSLHFSHPVSQGEIDMAAIENILSTEINKNSSAYFNFIALLKLDGQSFLTSFSLDTYNNLNYYTYNNFDFTITDYEVDYQADCLEKEAIRVKGSLSGTLYKYQDNSNFIEVEIPDFEILLLIE